MKSKVEASLSKDIQELVSKLILDLFDLSLMIEQDDDDAEADDHSLIELAGDMLELIFEDMR